MGSWRVVQRTILAKALSAKSLTKMEANFTDLEWDFWQDVDWPQNIKQRNVYKYTLCCLGLAEDAK